MSKPGFGPFKPVWTDGTTSGKFFPFTGAMRTATTKSVYSGLDVYDNTGDVHVEIGWQESDDGITWPAATSFTLVTYTPSVDGTDATVNDTTFETLSPQKSYLRFGAVVKNKTATSTRGVANVALKIETRSC